MLSPHTVIDHADSAASARRTGLFVRVWRRRHLFAMTFGLVIAATLLAFFVLPVRYVATGSVIVAEQEPGLPNASAAWAQKIGDPADLESQLLVIRSPRIIRLAMAKPGIHDAVLRECRYDATHGVMAWLRPGRIASCDKLQPESEALLSYVEFRYKVGSVGRSRVINVAYQSSLPDVSQNLANALITAFLEDQRATLSSSREAAASWIWQELRQLDADVRQQDAKVQEFRRAKGLMRGMTAPISSERLTSISQQLSSAEALRADAAARLREITDQPGGAKNAPAVLASRSIADLKQQIAAVSSQLANSSFVLGDKHPTRRALERERDILEERLAAEVVSITASAKKTYDAADALVTSLQRQMAQIKAEVADATADEASIESMVRSANIKRQEYSDLYKRASELETERRVLVGSTRLVNLAELPTRPYFPKPLPFAAGGLTLATLLAFAAALLRDRADRSVRASTELSVVTGAPIFAQLPQLMRPQTPVVGLFSSRQAELPLAQALAKGRQDPILQDALRRLFAEIGLARRGSKCLRSLLVTSSGPREGKTFTTLALAQLVAATGRRVLAVECDMRRPTFATALDLPKAPGLSAVLAGETTVQDAVVSTGTPNLDVVPAGAPTASSTELLMGLRMSELLAWAETYDMVLLDSPPASILMDARILAKYVDGVLCCARWGHSSIAAAVATIEGLRASGGEVLGMAITMVEPGDHALYETPPVPAVAYYGANA